MICIACPGQGSQTPGFFEPWLEIPIFRNHIERFSDVLELDLIRLGTAADADEIRDTRVAQPLIVAAGIASYLALREKMGEVLKVDATAGHSVGEITAGFVAGVFGVEQALGFVQKRGQEMAEAAAITPSSMAAVLGGDATAVISHLEQLGLSAANYNGAGQIVAAGSKQNIAKLVESPPVGTRVIQLQVAGAFHTEFMKPAKAPLDAFARNLQVSDPNVLLWSNFDGKPVDSGGKFLDLLVNQVSSPVRWDMTMDSMNVAGVSVMIELLPAGALSGIAKRAMPNTVAIAVKSPADLDKVAEAVGK